MVCKAFKDFVWKKSIQEGISKDLSIVSSTIVQLYDLWPRWPQKGLSDFFQNLQFWNQSPPNKKEEVCHGFLVNIFTKSLLTGGVRAIQKWISNSYFIEGNNKFCVIDCPIYSCFIFDKNSNDIGPKTTPWYLNYLQLSRLLDEMFWRILWLI